MLKSKVRTRQKPRRRKRGLRKRVDQLIQKLQKRQKENYNQRITNIKIKNENCDYTNKINKFLKVQKKKKLQQKKLFQKKKKRKLLKSASFQMPFNRKSKKIQKSLRNIASISLSKTIQHDNLIHFGKLIEDQLHYLRAQEPMVNDMCKMTRKQANKNNVQEVWEEIRNLKKQNGILSQTLQITEHESNLLKIRNKAEQQSHDLYKKKHEDAQNDLNNLQQNNTHEKQESDKQRQSDVKTLYLKKCRINYLEDQMRIMQTKMNLLKDENQEKSIKQYEQKSLYMVNKNKRRKTLCGMRTLFTPKRKPIILNRVKSTKNIYAQPMKFNFNVKKICSRGQ